MICGNLTISSFIQTILLVLELHQIVRFTLADFTANREFHPAPKTLLFCCSFQIITFPVLENNGVEEVRKYFGNLHFTEWDLLGIQLNYNNRRIQLHLQF